MDVVHWESRPALRRPVLVVAFQGWNDAAEGATVAARFLSRAWGARRFASIDPEEFYDFTETRPHVRLEDGHLRRISWPANELEAAALPGSQRDVVFLHGVEPQLRWRTFTNVVLDVAKALDVDLVVSLGALLAAVPHTRPVRIVGTAADPEVVERLGLRRSTYEGPTGIVGVLHAAMREAGVASASLWANAPHYLPQTRSPKVALALVEEVARLLGTSVPTTELDLAAAAYERQVAELMETEDEIAEYIRQLELAADEERLDEVAEGESLAAEAERYLREHRREP
jgi:proteasome assembly chaperone (PAC2) family protein